MSRTMIDRCNPLSPPTPAREMILRLKVDHPLMPEQLLSLPQHYQQPERRLMAAVLLDAGWAWVRQTHPAVADWQRHRQTPQATRERKERLRRELLTWFCDPDTTYPYSFLSVCAHLDLDPSWVRARLNIHTAKVTHAAQ